MFAKITEIITTVYERVVTAQTNILYMKMYRFRNRFCDWGFMQCLGWVQLERYVLYASRQ